MTTEQNALAKAGGKKELQDWLQSDRFKLELASILPEGLTAERFVRIAFQATFRNPKLLRCSQESFFNCLLSLGAMGLEPDGRNAHLIPFGDTCTLVVDYKGIAQILRRNRDLLSLHCDVVYTRDDYEAEQGTNQHLRHVKYRGSEGRGSPILAYSFVRLPDGTQEFDEMTFGEIEAIRKRSRTPNEGPWVTDWDQMARKTVFRRHAKTLPLSPKTRDALDRELDGDAIPITSAPPFKTATVLPEPARRRGRPPKAPPEAPQTPPEPSEPTGDSPHNVGSDSAATEELAEPRPLHEQLLERVLDAGYTEEQMLAAMVSRKMADPRFKTLAECGAHHLLSCVEQWPAALDLLQKFTASQTTKVQQQAKAQNDKLL
jgi:recombination protein RecT